MNKLGPADARVFGSRRGRAFVATARRALWLLKLPFRFVAVMWRRAIALGVGAVRFGVDLIAAALGLAVLLFVGLCLARVLFHPMFLR